MKLFTSENMLMKLFTFMWNFFFYTPHVNKFQKHINVIYYDSLTHLTLFVSLFTYSSFISHMLTKDDLTLCICGKTKNL